MEAIWSFLQQYGQYIWLGLVLVLDLLLLILKKRPQVIDNSLIAKIIPLVAQAEEKFVSGEDKLQYVLNGVRAYLGDYYKENEARYLVELLLTLPQKKGVQYGTKKS